MAASANQIRPSQPVGSGTGEPCPAAASSVGTLRETARSGRATDDTLTVVVPLADGGEVRFLACHGRVEMQVRIGKARVWNTTPMSAERGEDVGARIAEVSQHARAQRQAKGA